jgi:asparagine synthase (glutamine-hydrolysing)
VRNDELDAFTDALAHRGPDGRGTWRDDGAGIGLGHRRLAILDLTAAGGQPMSDASGRIWITFNGEIYNFIEIRAELETKGYKFRTQTDTEVILAAYQEWGQEMLPRFNGMWALAIFDCKLRRLFFARDRFGIKPFYYLYNKELFAFASELKAFRTLPEIELSMDRQYAQAFLQDGLGVEGTEEKTIASGVRRLLAGHSGTLQDGRLSLCRWWSTMDQLVGVPASLEKQAEEFGHLFYDSVRLRMRSDVSIGTCLSGGFDSTSIVCTLGEIGRRERGLRLAKDWQKAFVATFPGSDNDESALAKDVVKYAGLEGHFFSVTDEQALPEIDQILFDFDDLYISLPTAPWLLYRELRRERTLVSLDGHGADELMGAYVQYDRLLLGDAPSWLRHPLENVRRVRLCFETMPEAQRSQSSVGRGYQAAMMSLRNHPQLAPIARRLRQWRTALGLGRHSKFLRASPRIMPRPSSVLRYPGEWGPMNRELYQMFHYTILPAILRNFDRLSMAHGVEIRMPFMDWRLVRFIMSLPEESKIAGGVTKRVAREAMRNRIPETIRTSKLKIGFNSPMPKWMAGPLRSWALDLTCPAVSGGHDLVDEEALRRMFRSGREAWNWSSAQEVWPCLHVLWFERNFFRRGSLVTKIRI